MATALSSVGLIPANAEKLEKEKENRVGFRSPTPIESLVSRTFSESPTGLEPIGAPEEANKVLDELRTQTAEVKDPHTRMRFNALLERMNPDMGVARTSRTRAPSVPHIASADSRV